ncbi:Tripartite tricarboxylate transporter family receptor [compost metagenome]|uniref:Bug family tripartite tricarboxylate transporter substrate binding protein n=1 Tax=Achromobacter sp. Root83 TaxID=1736602 RepID=UPI0009EBC244|nr:tripartite tricarboxylate transporter substrate binding protein [Achromobacter sp. Root83]
MKAFPLLRRMSAVFAVAAFGASAAHAADDWPRAKAITLVVPFAAGGTSDILGRLIAQELGTTLSQTVVVENKGGAGGVLGADAVARAKPDGYTLLLGTIATHAINPSLLPSINYNAAKDFAPVILLGSISNVLLVGANQPYKTVQEVVAAAKANPDTIAFGSAGQGTSQHLSGEVFKQLTGAHLTHVPYRGSAPAIQDLIGGQIPSSFETALVALPYVQSGKVRALAVTSAKRTAVLPDVPTMQEAGVSGFDVSSWQAIYVPANTPPAVVDKLNKAIAGIVAKPEVSAKMQGLGLAYTPNSPAEFASFQAGEQAKWAKIVADGKLKTQ